MTCAAAGAYSTGVGPYAAGTYLAPNKNVLVDGPQLEVLSLEEAKLRAGLDWPPGDPRDAQMDLFIKAARSRVERDTGYALLTQTRDIYLSHLVPPAEFPAPARPLISIEEVLVPTVEHRYEPLPRTRWSVVPDGRLTFIGGPPPEPPPPLQEAVLYPWIVRIVVGWEAPKDVPPLLQFAVGLLCAHYATAARDIAIIGTSVVEVPLGYEDAIDDFRQRAA